MMTGSNVCRIAAPISSKRLVPLFQLCFSKRLSETNLSPLVLRTSRAPAQGATPTSTEIVTRSCAMFPPIRCRGSRGPKTEAETEVRPEETVAEPSEAG